MIRGLVLRRIAVGVVSGVVFMTAYNMCDDQSRLPFRLVSEAELADLERDAMDRVEAYRSRTCPRPVLRGTPLAGSGEADMIALVEGTADNEACFEQLGKPSEFLLGYTVHPVEQKIDPWPLRAWGIAREPADPAVSGFEFAPVRAACSDAIEHMRRATRHAEACSPYLPGKRGLPELYRQMRLAKLTAHLAHRLIGADDVAGALDLLLDALRFGQDMGRGGAGLIPNMITVASDHYLAPLLELALNRPAPTESAVLERVDRALRLLIEGEPHPQSFLQAERLELELKIVLPQVKGPDWEPPGGWGADEGPPTQEQITGSSDPDFVGLEGNFNAKQEDRPGLMWMRLKLDHVKATDACPTSRPPMDCYRTLGEHDEWDEAEVWKKIAPLKEKLKPGIDEAKARRIRDQVLHHMAFPAGGPYRKYFVRSGSVRFILTAARLHAAFRKLAQAQRRCPELNAFEREPLLSLREFSFDGMPLLVEPLGQNRFVIRAATPLEENRDPDKEPLWFVECPLAKR